MPQLDDIWADFNRNGHDAGFFGDFDRILLDDEGGASDRVIRRPIPVSNVDVHVFVKPCPVAVQKYPASVECNFCKNIAEFVGSSKGHAFKDRRGIVTCPVLRKHTCEICGATGDRAHTRRYCPKKKIYSEEDTVRMEMKRRSVN